MFLLQGLLSPRSGQPSMSVQAEGAETLEQAGQGCDGDIQDQNCCGLL